MASYADRYPQNAPGPFYVDDQCIDCDLCRERIPEVFHRNDEDAHSYVGRQPRDEAEHALCNEALNDCPVEAIGTMEVDRMPGVKKAVSVSTMLP